jgi:hypothetical protein
MNTVLLAIIKEILYKSFQNVNHNETVYSSNKQKKQKRLYLNSIFFSYIQKLILLKIITKD